MWSKQRSWRGIGSVRCSRRPRSVGRASEKRAPKGVTSIRRVISVHSCSADSRQCTRAGSASLMRSRRRFDLSSVSDTFQAVFPPPKATRYCARGAPRNHPAKQGKSVDFTGVSARRRGCQKAPFGLQYVVLSERPSAPESHVPHSPEKSPPRASSVRRARLRTCRLKGGRRTGRAPSARPLKVSRRGRGKLYRKGLLDGNF